MLITCIKCHDDEQTVTVNLTDDHTFRCLGCEEEYDADDVREYLDRLKDWSKVLAWVETSPFRCEAPAADKAA